MGSFLRDVALAASGWLLLEASEIAWNALGGRGVAGSVAAWLPRTGVERVAWIVVSVSVGVSEELVYRGYLQKQLGAYARRRGAGIVLQAALFGIAHADQGAAAAIRFAVYGIAFGALARWRGLLPGMICHVGIDVASGLL
jgi:membrane protease YdiL (CAAX protease family)